MTPGRRSRCGFAHDRWGGEGGACGAVFEGFQALHEAGHGFVGAGQDRADAGEFEQQARGGRAPHAGESGGDHFGHAGEGRGAHAGGLAGHLRELVGGGVDESGRARVGDLGEHDEVAEAFEEVAGEAPGVVAAFDDALDDFHDGGAVGGGEGLAHFVEESGVGDAEESGGALVGDAFGSGAGDELVEDGEGVAGGAAAGADDEGEHVVGDDSAFFVAEFAAEFAHRGGRDEPERVVVGARADGGEDFVRLGGGEDEQDVVRGFFDQFEQGVEACGGDHVGFVDDVDLEAGVDGGEDGAFAQFAGVVDAAVAGGVDFDDVDRAVSVGRQRAAGAAFAAGFGGGSLGAVEGAGEDAGRGGLAAAAGPGEQVGVVEAPGADGVDERLGDVFLADDFGEGLRPVFAVQRECHVILLLAGLFRCCQGTAWVRRSAARPVVLVRAAQVGTSDAVWWCDFADFGRCWGGFAHV